MIQKREALEKFNFLVEIFFSQSLKNFSVLLLAENGKYAFGLAHHGSLPRLVIDECQLPERVAIIESNNFSEPFCVFLII